MPWEPWMQPPTPKDWAEDFPAENGCYCHVCPHCKAPFRGHKRRYDCRECVAAVTAAPGKVDR